MDSEEFDAFSDALDSTALVVTTRSKDGRSGCLVGFSTQCSIDPPRLLVCLSRANHTYDVALGAEFLAAHVLGPDGHSLAELFGGTTGDELDKFAHCEWEEGPGGVPLLSAAAHRMVGRVVSTHDLGDHAGFVLAPLLAEELHSGSGVLEMSDVSSVQAGHPA